MLFKSQNVLIVTNHYLTGRTGGSKATIGFIELFSDIFGKCYLIYPEANDFRPPVFINENIDLLPCIDHRPFWLKGIMVYFGVLHRFSTTVMGFIKGTPIDYVVFDTSIVSRNLIKILIQRGIKVITIHHNVEIDYFADNKPSPLIRIPYLFFIRKTEQEALKRSHLSLTLTYQDKCRLEKLYFDGHVTERIQQLGVYEKISLHNDYRFSGSYSRSNEKVVFVMTGSLSFIQSDMSIRNFINVYLPCIEKKISNYELLIGGSDPSMKLIEYVSSFPNLRLIPDPVDLSEIVEMGDIYLCPVEMGSGMKLRIMDGLKAGLPVITHKVSGKGYEAFISNGFMFEYDSVDSFNQLIPKALSVKINRSQIKDLYVKTFSLESGKKRLEDILKQQLTTE